MKCFVCYKGTLRSVDNVLECEDCHVKGSYFDLQQKSLGQIDNRYAFYYCEELDCGLFYRTNTPQTRPVVEFSVMVPRLDNQKVRIALTGLGQEGLDRLLDRSGDPAIFPVDLFHRPYIIDPHLSRTVDQKLLDEWNGLIEYRRAWRGRSDTSKAN